LPRLTLLPYTTLFRSRRSSWPSARSALAPSRSCRAGELHAVIDGLGPPAHQVRGGQDRPSSLGRLAPEHPYGAPLVPGVGDPHRSEEHTSELQSRFDI